MLLKYTPRDILIHIKSGKLDISTAVDITLSSLDYDCASRPCFVKLLGKLGHRGERIFKFLENLFVSDYDKEVRSTAAEVLFYLFPERSGAVLEWVSKNDSDLWVLHSIYHIVKNENIDNKKIIENLISNIERNYRLLREEIPFFLDLGLKFLKYETYINGRIKAVDLGNHRLRDIPESIGLLSCLAHLNLRRNHLRKLPKSFSKLKRLHTLNLSGNKFKKVPECLIPLTKRNLSQKYIRRGVNRKDAVVLGILEIFIGQKFIDVEVELKKPHSDFSQVYRDPSTWQPASHYKLKNEGYIIGLYIDSYKMRESWCFNFFPEQIYDLKYLEELRFTEQRVLAIPSYETLKARLPRLKYAIYY